MFETLNRIARGDIPDVRTFAPGCPPAIAAFLAAALSAERGRRPASAKEFKARLSEAARAAG